jgi:hypothetical protein
MHSGETRSDATRLNEAAKPAITARRDTLRSGKTNPRYAKRQNPAKHSPAKRSGKTLLREAAKPRRAPPGATWRHHKTKPNGITERGGIPSHHNTERQISTIQSGKSAPSMTTRHPDAKRCET